MNAIDFEYDGQYLSDYGFIICDFNGSSGADTVTAGSLLTFNKVARLNGYIHSLTSVRYDECITTEFDICKNPDENDDMEIYSDEFRDLMRWLNRKDFHTFQIDDQEGNMETYYFEASFNIEKIKIREKLYGMHLIMETNRPFAFGSERSYRFTFNDISSYKVINDPSDELGFIYPKVVITCNANGDLSITNDLSRCTTTIKGCTTGETITIDGENQVIITSNTTHRINNDFNFEFLKIGNTIDDRKNRITVTKPCVLDITYRPIIKEVP